MTLRLGTSFPPFSIHILTRTCPQQLQSHLHNSHVGTASLRNQPLHRVILTVPSAPCDPLPSAPWILTIPSHRAIFSIPSAPCDPHHPLCTVRSSPYPLHCVILYPLHRVILTIPSALCDLLPSAPCDPLPSAPWILTIPSAPCDSLPSAPCDPHQNTTSAPGDPHHTLSLIQTTFPHRATIHTLPGATTTIIAAFTFLTYAA